GQAGLFPLVLVLVPSGARLRLRRPLWKGTVFDIPLVFFLLTAFAATWFAYDREAAWAKWWLIVAGLFAFYALARQPVRNVWAVATSLGCLSTAAAVYFLFTHDWLAYPAKFDGLRALVAPWMALRPGLGLPQLHPNVMASLVALLSPYLVVAAARARRLEQRWLWRAAVIALVVNGGTLLLAASRGAVVALLAAVLLWVVWQAGVSAGRRLDVPPLAISVLLVLAALLLLAPAAGAAGGPLALLDGLPGPASASNRATLAQQTAALIADYPLIGGGLASFPGLYSHYSLVIPHYMLPNGHNIFLDVWLEQGILGLLGLLVVLGGSFWLLARGSQAGRQQADGFGALRWAIASSMLVILVHGLVEDTVYGSVALPVLFAGPGLAVALKPAAPRVAWRRFVPVVAVAAALLFVLPTMRARWHANWGAVQMARVELSGWPTNQWSDGHGAAALAPAESHFRRSLALDPGNRTAHHRLGLAAMARHEYSVAIQHLKRARALDRKHAGIRKALAYSTLWSGDVEAAVPLLAETPGASVEIESYVRWWRTQERADLSRLAQQAARQLDP
ncbi:MAG: O-antigen ligase family protein, partial [Anaerolineae bacterium]|nr:O-antigen ligase family protein [Anaerolineae bacterium]